MVERDKAFWVDKPGANAYTLHDAFDTYEMKVGITLPREHAAGAVQGGLSLL